MHAARRCYAAVVLDAREGIRAVDEYLGHHDPGFTLRTYTYTRLMPSGGTRTRAAVDGVFSDEEPTGRPGHGPGRRSALRPAQ